MQSPLRPASGGPAGHYFPCSKAHIIGFVPLLRHCHIPPYVDMSPGHFSCVTFSHFFPLGLCFFSSRGQVVTWDPISDAGGFHHQSPNRKCGWGKPLCFKFRLSRAGLGLEVFKHAILSNILQKHNPYIAPTIQPNYKQD